MPPDPGPRLPASALPDLLTIAIPFALGALLTAIDLGSRSLWLDEGSTFAIVSQHGAALWHGIAHDGGNMLLYYLVMHVLLAWFGHSVVVMRLPSVVASACTGGLVAALALRLFAGNRRLAAVAGALTVSSLPLVYWGQNARGYAWLVALATASFLALVEILRTPPGQAPRRGALIAYTLSTLAAMYVGYDVVLLVPAQLALLVAHRERARALVGCLALVALASVPLFVLALERGSGQLFWVRSLDWQIAGQAALSLLSAALLPNFHRTATTAVAAAVLGLALLAAVAAAVAAVRSAAPHRSAAPNRSAAPHSPAAPPRPAPLERFGEREALLVLLSWILVTALLTVCVYAVGEPIELERTTILLLPAVALITAWLLLRPAVAPALGLAGVAVLFGLRLAQVVPSYGVSPEPWNRATAYVLAATPASRPACVAFYAQDGREVFDYYLLARAGAHDARSGAGDARGGGGRRARGAGDARGGAGDARAGADPAPSLRPVLPALPWRTVRPFVERYETLSAAAQARVVAGCPRLWLLSSHAGQLHGTAQSLANLRRLQRLERDLGARYPHVTLRHFGWASPIVVRLFWRGRSLQGRSHRPT